MTAGAKKAFCFLLLGLLVAGGCGDDNKKRVDRLFEEPILLSIDVTVLPEDGRDQATGAPIELCVTGDDFVDGVTRFVFSSPSNISSSAEVFVPIKTFISNSKAIIEAPASPVGVGTVEVRAVNPEVSSKDGNFGQLISATAITITYVPRGQVSAEFRIDGNGAYSRLFPLMSNIPLSATVTNATNESITVLSASIEWTGSGNLGAYLRQFRVFNELPSGITDSTGQGEIEWRLGTTGDLPWGVTATGTLTVVTAGDSSGLVRTTSAQVSVPLWGRPTLSAEGGDTHSPSDGPTEVEEAGHIRIRGVSSDDTEATITVGPSAVSSSAPADLGSTSNFVGMGGEDLDVDGEVDLASGDVVITSADNGLLGLDRLSAAIIEVDGNLIIRDGALFKLGATNGEDESHKILAFDVSGDITIFDSVVDMTRPDQAFEAYTGNTVLLEAGGTITIVRSTIDVSGHHVTLDDGADGGNIVIEAELGVHLFGDAGAATQLLAVGGRSGESNVMTAGSGGLILLGTQPDGTDNVISVDGNSVVDASGGTNIGQSFGAGGDGGDIGIVAADSGDDDDDDDFFDLLNDVPSIEDLGLFELFDESDVFDEELEFGSVLIDGQLRANGGDTVGADPGAGGRIELAGEVIGIGNPTNDAAITANGGSSSVSGGFGGYGYDGGLIDILTDAEADDTSSTPPTAIRIAEGAGLTASGGAGDHGGGDGGTEGDGIRLFTADDPDEEAADLSGDIEVAGHLLAMGGPCLDDDFSDDDDGGDGGRIDVFGAGAITVTSTGALLAYGGSPLLQEAQLPALDGVGISGGNGGFIRVEGGSDPGDFEGVDNDRRDPLDVQGVCDASGGSFLEDDDRGDGGSGGSIADLEGEGVTIGGTVLARGGTELQGDEVDDDDFGAGGFIDIESYEPDTDLEDDSAADDGTLLVQATALIDASGGGDVPFDSFGGAVHLDLKEAFEGDDDDDDDENDDPIDVAGTVRALGNGGLIQATTDDSGIDSTSNFVLRDGGLFEIRDGDVHIFVDDDESTTVATDIDLLIEEGGTIRGYGADYVLLLLDREEDQDVGGYIEVNGVIEILGTDPFINSPASIIILNNSLDDGTSDTVAGDILVTGRLTDEQRLDDEGGDGGHIVMATVRDDGDDDDDDNENCNIILDGATLQVNATGEGFSGGEILIGGRFGDDPFNLDFDTLGVLPGSYNTTIRNGSVLEARSWTTLNRGDDDDDDDLFPPAYGDIPVEVDQLGGGSIVVVGEETITVTGSGTTLDVGGLGTFGSGGVIGLVNQDFDEPGTISVTDSATLQGDGAGLGNGGLLVAGNSSSVTLNDGALISLQGGDNTTIAEATPVDGGHGGVVRFSAMEAEGEVNILGDVLLGGGDNIGGPGGTGGFFLMGALSGGFPDAEPCFFVMDEAVTVDLSGGDSTYAAGIGGAGGNFEVIQETGFADDGDPTITIAPASGAITIDLSGGDGASEGGQAGQFVAVSDEDQVYTTGTTLDITPGTSTSGGPDGNTGLAAFEAPDIDGTDTAFTNGEPELGSGVDNPPNILGDPFLIVEEFFD